MKIVVIGTCQAWPLADCLAVMMPGVRVERFLSTKDPGNVAQDGDVIFRQRDRRRAWTPAQLRPNEFLFPRIWFNAFHPDLVYIAGPEGPVPPPLGDYHSSLVLYAWQRRMSRTEAARLFCEPVFERLKFFDCWDAATRVLLEEGTSIRFPLDAFFARWQSSGCFMYTPNHPALTVIGDIARALVERAGLRTALNTPEYYLNDPMQDNAIWPVYPEIGRRLGLQGAYAFKLPRPPGGAIPPLLDLDEFIDRAFEAYAQMEPRALRCERLQNPFYRDLESVLATERKGSANGAVAGAASASRSGEWSPYAELPSFHFWRRAVEQIPVSDVDPVGTPPFLIDRRARIATAGSCFAQNMSRVLARRGFNYFVAEPAPHSLSAEEARHAGYGVFSARCGNIYTARQLLQLFDRAYGLFVPRDRAWLRPDGRYADPFRSQIEPAGFAAVEQLLESQEHHFAAVRTMFEQLDVFIFTLGLTEAWRSTTDGAVFSSAPGVVAGRIDPARHEFVNFTAADVRDDLDGFVTRLRSVNPGARVVLTVSPVPLIATYEPRHVLVSATFSKAALRVAADEMERAHHGVWYFPAYEIIACAYNRGTYYEQDLRTVTPGGVDHVMRLFFEHATAPEDNPAEPDMRMLAENRDNLDVVCDEEAATYGEAAPQPRRGAPAVHWPEFNKWRSGEEADGVSVWTAPSSGVMDALEPASMRAPLDGELPSEMTAGTIRTVRCTITNHTGVPLVSGGRHPIFLCYRWFDAAGQPTEIGLAIHTPLPNPLEPGASLSLAMRIAGPQYEGPYHLRAALLQSEVAWFDDVDPENGLTAVVNVTPRTALGPP